MIITNSIESVPHERPTVVRNVTWNERKIQFSLNSVTSQNPFHSVTIITLLKKNRNEITFFSTLLVLLFVMIVCAAVYIIAGTRFYLQMMKFKKTVNR